MKIVITIPRTPFPLNSGGRIAIYNTLRSLSKRHTLTLIIIDDDKNNIKYIDSLRSFSENIYFFGKSKFQCFTNSFLGILKNRPLQVGYFYFNDIQKLINTLHKSHDLFFAFMIRTSSYGINLKMNKINYSIDSMYLNYLKSSKNATSFLWKIVYKIELPLLLKIEKLHIKKFNLTTFVNKDESFFWAKYGKVSNLPHGIDNSVFNYSNFNPIYKNVIAFVGRMDYQPNIDAVKWFCSLVMPKVDKSILFYIIGGYPKKEILELENSNIKVLGFVDDPYEIIKSCICTVSPMQTGGGLQTKTLISMALNCIVISSSNAAKPIEGALNKKNIIIEDEPDKIANIIHDINNHPNNYLSIKTECKKLVFDNYSEDIIENQLFELLQEFII